MSILSFQTLRNFGHTHFVAWGLRNAASRILAESAAQAQVSGMTMRGFIACRQ